MTILLGKIKGGDRYRPHRKTIPLNDGMKIIINDEINYYSSDPRDRTKFHTHLMQVYLKTKSQILCVGACHSDSGLGEKEWIKCNSKCIIFLKGNTIANQYYVDKIFDITLMKVVQLSKQQIESQYGIKLEDNIKVPEIEEKEKLKAKLKVKQRTPWIKK